MIEDSKILTLFKSAAEDLDATVPTEREMMLREAADKVQDIVIKTEGDSDQDIARTNLKAVSAFLAEPLKHLASLAIGSDSPRAYEVLAGMAKTLVEASKTLYDMAPIEDKDPKLIDGSSVEFVGTPGEMMALKKTN